MAEQQDINYDDYVKRHHNEQMPADDVAMRPDLMARESGFTEGVKRLFGGDKVLWVIVVALMVISLLVVYSSTAKMAYMPNSGSSTTAFLRKQLFMLAACVVIIFVVHRINSDVFRRLAKPVFWISLGLTLAAYFVGVKTNDAARWINIMGFQFQPSEMLKVGTIMYLARALADKQSVVRNIRIVPSLKFWTWSTPKQRRIIKEGAMPLFFPIILSCAIIIPAHTSSALLVGALSLVMLYIGRVKWADLFRIVGLAVAGFALLMLLGLGRSETAEGRLSTWWKLWTENRTEVMAKDLTDTERSMIAIHNGGIMGRGAGQSAVRVEMTHPESDYAFAFFVEEYGIVLSMILIALYVWVFFRAIEIFDKCPKKFPSMLSLGLAMMITSQALLHIMVTVNIFPETGQTLPMISRGGSSLLFTAVSLGMILSVSRQTEEGTHSDEA
ncbi:MAG: FtsW/RodA/SpoVE family cell cycle protein [Alistipes sp.]|nr:FtsW/RodA/SpoVE family cell cycle protein [Alistipes sp.]